MTFIKIGVQLKINHIFTGQHLTAPLNELFKEFTKIYRYIYFVHANVVEEPTVH